MGLSRLEVNIRRSLAKCELMIKDKTPIDDNRIEKYVDSLDEMLIQLEKSTDKPERENIKEYYKRLDKLKNYLSNKKNKKSPTSSSELFRDVTNSDDNFASASGIQKNIPKYKNPRAELFGIDDDSVKVASLTPGDDVDMLLKYHDTVQDRVTNEMLILSRNLKEQTALAGTIIKKDTEVLKKSTKVSEDNFHKLKVESEKLQEHTKRACKCWMWVMIIIVMAVFINMVLFMKVMKKKV